MISAGRAWQQGRSRSPNLQLALGATAALAAAATFVLIPGLLVLPVAVALALLLANSPLARLIFIVFGGLLVFQSSAAISPEKVAYLLGTFVCVAAAARTARRLEATPALQDVRPLLFASLVLAVLVAVSLVVAIANGTAPTAWMRDSIPYLLFAIAPVMALDAQHAISTRTTTSILVVAGFLTSIGFAVKWLSLRGIVQIPFGAGLGSLLLAAALFSLAVSVVLEGSRGRAFWTLVAALVFAAFLTTGTRSTLLLLAAPLAIVVASRQHFWRRSIRLVIVLPLIAALVFLASQSIIDAAHLDRQALAERLHLVVRSGGQSDMSYLERLSQTSAAWNLFKESPWLGVGPGHPIRWQTATGAFDDASNVDSPVAFLTKFGISGLIALFVLVVAYGRVVGNLRQRTGVITVPQLALVGFGGVIAASAIIDVPFEDKGVGSGLILLLALALRDLREPFSERGP